MTNTATPVQFLLQERFGVGESPVWDAGTQTLYWCDIPAGLIHAIHLATRQRRHWSLGESVASFGLALNGQLVVALQRTVILFDPLSEGRRLVATIALPKPGMRLNDGKVGPDGAFYVGSMDPDGAPAEGALYRVGADGAVTKLASGFETSNGLAWTADGTTLFHSDSRGDMFIDRWTFDRRNGTIGNRRRLREHDEANGRADGGAFDIAGAYWSAAPSRSRLNQIHLDGTLTGWVDLPLLRPTMPCFGGPDMRTIFVTSLDSGLAEDGRDGIVMLRSPAPGVPVAIFGSATAAD